MGWKYTLLSTWSSQVGGSSGISVFPTADELERQQEDNPHKRFSRLWPQTFFFLEFRFFLVAWGDVCPTQSWGCGEDTRMVERLINPEDAHAHVSSQTRETETDSMRVARGPNILLKGSVFKAQCFAVRLAFTRDHQNLATPALLVEPPSLKRQEAFDKLNLWVEKANVMLKASVVVQGGWNSL